MRSPPQRGGRAVRARDTEAVQDGQGIEHVRRLELPADAERHAFLGWKPHDGPAVDEDVAARPLAAVGDAAQEGRLAGAVRSDDSHHLTAPGLEADAVEHLEAAVALAHLSQLQDRRPLLLAGRRVPPPRATPRGGRPNLKRRCARARAADAHVARAGQRRDGAAGGDEADLQARRPEAQVSATLLVLANRDEEAAGVA